MKARSSRFPRLVGVISLTLALFAVLPANQAADSVGTALAADTPPAVAQPVPAASNPSSPTSTETPAPTSMMGADANALSSDPLAYHRESYVYASKRLRDPFGSLMQGRFVSDGSEKVPDIGSLELVGVMWGESDKFALCEDKEGQGYVLRVGDPVQNGEVSAITRESLTIRQYFFGSSTSVNLKLKPREGNSNGKNRRR